MPHKVRGNKAASRVGSKSLCLILLAAALLLLIIWSFDRAQGGSPVPAVALSPHGPCAGTCGALLVVHWRVVV